MKILLLFILSFCPLICIAQNTKRIETKYKNSKLIKEEYEVLKKNKSVKHGIYKSYYPNGQQKEFGHFTNNLKNGQWFLFDQKGGKKEIQYYNHSEKSGIWEKYMERGLVIQRYDYDNDTALSPMIYAPGIKYPDLAEGNGVQGSVEIRFVFNQECDIEEIIYLNKLGFGCEEEAVSSYRKFVDLSKRYNPDFKDCAGKEEVFRVEFRLD